MYSKGNVELLFDRSNRDYNKKNDGDINLHVENIIKLDPKNYEQDIFITNSEYGKCIKYTDSKWGYLIGYLIDNKIIYWSDDEYWDEKIQEVTIYAYFN
jgi:hypothetical protein